MTGTTGLTASQMALMIQIMGHIANQKTTIPTEFHNQVSAVKSLLISDTSGLVNTTIDYAISAATVDMHISSDNGNFTSICKKWLDTINYRWAGKIPVGLKGLEKEYYRERWKGSSFIVLKTEWATVDGVLLPINAYPLDGGSVYTKDDNNDYRIDREYYLKTSKEDIPLINTETVRYYFQMPYTQWGAKYPVPYLLSKGIYKNAKFLDIVANKGESLVCEALEYLLLFKKGDKDLAKLQDPAYTYDEEDFKKLSKQFDDLQREKRMTGQTPYYMTGFDTEIDHLIPDYNKALQSSLFNPIESRILAGLGLVEIYTTSTRSELILNPRPFQMEVQSAASDFAALMNNILLDIKMLNESRRKYLNTNIRLHYSPVKEFITSEYKDKLRNLYDRGAVSKKTFVELVGDLNYENEVSERKAEAKRGEDKTMFPPVIQNLMGMGQPENEEIPDDKKGIEKLDYTQAIYETIHDLPQAIKELPVLAQELWMVAFNEAYRTCANEERAFQIAKIIVEEQYELKGNEWVKKEE